MDFGVMNRGVVWFELTQDVDQCWVLMKTMENSLVIQVRSNNRKRQNFNQNFKFFSISLLRVARYTTKQIVDEKVFL
jgi:hypothetical protein